MLTKQRKIDLLNCDHGFTLIEVIAILIILGIVAVVIVSRGSSTEAYNVVSEAEILKTHLRFAQLRAMNDMDNTWGITVNSGYYTLTCVAGTGTCPSTIPNLPGESSARHDFKDVSGPGTTNTISFDNWGSPSYTSPTITLTRGSDHAGITITPNTGFIQ